MCKATTRNEINSAMERFHARGGQINVINTGVKKYKETAIRQLVRGA